MAHDLLTRTATRLAACALVFAAAACQSVEPAEPPSRPAPSLVSGSEIAALLGLVRQPLDDGGKIALVAPGGNQILLFPDTTVVSVNGTQFKTADAVVLRGGDAWLTADDAAAIESIWASSTSSLPPGWTPPPPSATQPGPILPPRGTPVPPSWRYGDQPTASEVRQWSVSRLGGQWRFILLHHSATDSGSASQFDAWHKQKGWDGLGYDFVIGNGTGSADGAVEVGYRWREQRVGAHAGNKLMNEQSVGICLVGDFTKTRPTAAQMRSLSRLCNFLSGYCGIPRDNFRLHGDVRQTACPGPLFPRDFLAPQRSQRVALGTTRYDDGTK